MIPKRVRKAAQSGKGKIHLFNFNSRTEQALLLPLERRKGFMLLHLNKDLFIYEDDPYGEICLCWRIYSNI